MERAYNILGIGFLIIAAGATLVILILGVLNFTRDRTRRAPIIGQALAALAIWTVLTFVMFFANIVYMLVFEYGFMQGKTLKSPATTALVLGVGFLIYVLAGGGLIYWTKRQTKRFRAAPALR